MLMGGRVCFGGGGIDVVQPCQWIVQVTEGPQMQQSQLAQAANGHPISHCSSWSQ